jgi:hypothetical protein
MARVTYRPPRRRFADVANGREIKASLRRVAEGGKAFAESISPVDTGQYKTGTIEPGGFHIRETTSAQLVGRGPTGAVITAAVELVAAAPHSVFVERGNGTGKFRGYHVMQRTLEALKALPGAR